MTQILPTQTLLERAPVVIIGGGVIGDSIARHLGRLGLRDVVVLKRDKLTSGHFMARSGADCFRGGCRRTC